ncbi:MAG: hypothetical protein MHM6MM_002438 [Cercozoa sp. M6MM]
MFLIALLLGAVAHATARSVVKIDRNVLKNGDIRADVLADQVDELVILTHKDSELQWALHNGAQVLIEDFEALAADERARIARWHEEHMKDGVLTQQALAGWHDEFHNLEDTQAWWKNLATERFPTLFEYIDAVGFTWEGRQIPAMLMTSPDSPYDAPIVYVQALIHAREWISGATLMYIIEHLARQYMRNDPEAVKLLDTVRLAIVPVLNVDGYHHSHVVDRAWRKNRRRTVHTKCVGVDLNRNYDFMWGAKDGSSPDPCDNFYRGIGPFSELETLSTARWYETLGRDKSGGSGVVGALDLHCSSQVLLYPWGHKGDAPPHEAQLRQLGEHMARRMKEVHNAHYRVEQSMSGIYPTDGDSVDWWFSAGTKRHAGGRKQRRPYAYTLELRPDFTGGFVIDPKFIRLSGEEVYEGFVEFAQTAGSSPLPPDYAWP